jgi:hypothetical protein
MTEFVAESFINEFGQVIKPGDEVIFVGTSMKSTSIRKGIFSGVRYADVRRTNYLKDENGEYIKEDFTDPWGKTYRRNKTEIKTTREVVAVRVEKVNRGRVYKYIDGKYTRTEENRFSTSTLPLKRVFKIDTSLSALAGKSL